MYFTILFTIALIFDFLFGDPRIIPHPVRGIGKLCEVFEDVSRKTLGNSFSAGFLSFSLVLSSTLFCVLILLLSLHSISPWAEVPAALYLIYSGVAYRDLQKHSIAVYHALKNPGSLEEARGAIQQIVGRNTENLDEKGIVRACVETVAENLVDGVLSPIFWGILFSLIPVADLLHPLSMAALGVYFYKAINTMDSMYGYKNERYMTFGTFAARVDDLANFIPARLSGVFLIISGMLMGLDWRNGLKILVRDRYAHASPNGGHPEAAVAGILGISLGGPSTYFGIRVEKATLGDSLREIDTDDILKTNRLLLLCSVLFCTWILITRTILTG